MLSHLILTATLFVGNVGMVNAPIQSNYDNSETDPIVMILNQYSDFLFKGETGRSTVFTQEIQELISDRRSFYKDFLEIGLNIQFSSIDSKYLPIESTNLIKNDGGYELIVFEEITLHGNSMITTVEAYPLVQSAKWAINNTDNSAVLIALNDYLTSMEESVSNSLNEDIQIHLVLKHEMTFTEGRDNLLLIKDSFDDKSIENVDGTDVVVWKDEGFVRIKPDWTKFPDYQFFNTPIEELGKQLLLEYTSIYGKNLSKSEGFISSFDHSSAA
jgi:hypothetical protein